MPSYFHQAKIRQIIDADKEHVWRMSGSGDNRLTISKFLTLIDPDYHLRIVPDAYCVSFSCKSARCEVRILEVYDGSKPDLSAYADLWWFLDSNECALMLIFHDYKTGSHIEYDHQQCWTIAYQEIERSLAVPQLVAIAGCQ